MLTQDQREIRKLKLRLKELSGFVAVAIEAIDRQMKNPSSPERGSKIAKIFNALELKNDSTLHSTLGLTFPQMKAFKKKLIKQNGG
jgi:hypothetical protein